MLDNTGDQSDVMSPLIELGSLLANTIVCLSCILLYHVRVVQLITLSVPSTVTVQLGAAKHLCQNYLAEPTVANSTHNKTVALQGREALDKMGGETIVMREKKGVESFFSSQIPRLLLVD